MTRLRQLTGWDSEATVMPAAPRTVALAAALDQDRADVMAELHAELDALFAPMIAESVAFTAGLGRAA